MSKYWSDFVRDLHPYVPGEQPKIPNLTKLNTNENPYGPSPQVLEAVRAELSDSLRLYPDPTAAALRESIARHLGASEQVELTPQHVFVGNGSDEVLAHAFFGLFKKALPILFPDITYSFYDVYCGLYGIEFRKVALSESFEVSVNDYQAPNGGVILPNPNAPTGIAMPRDSIEALVRQNPDAVVLIDEAYVDFGAESAIRLVTKYPNLLVCQTFSKSRSLAGMRLGYAIGHPDLIEALIRVKDSFNSYPIDRLAIVGGRAALEDREYFEQTRQAIILDREWVRDQLARLGFEVLPSSANFVFARHRAWEGATLAAELRARAVLVRHFAKPRISEFLRITIGKPDENQRLIAALGEILRAS